MLRMFVKLGVFFTLFSTFYCKKFGYNNSLTCNCNYESSCQDSGMCSSGGCRQGWSGPTCQKENIAYNKQSNQSRIYTTTKLSSLAVDGYIDTGNYSTCTDMSRTKQGWWLVDLQQTYPITDINIYHYEQYYLSRLQGFSVYIIDEDLVSTLCYHHTNEPLTDEYKIRCNSTGRYINIRSAIVPDDRVNDSFPGGVLNLCEVKIYVCSVGTYGPNCSSYCHCSQYARCEYVTGYCKDGCLPGWDGNDCNQKCSVGYYGANCQQLCFDRNCKSSDLTCDHVNGTCIDGCKNGWTSHDCSKECSIGYYGANCQQLCSDRNCRSSDLTCDHVNGTCIDGCKNGWTSHDCSKECSVRYYGANCEQQCSDRKCISSDLTCDHVNGTCVNGCIAGWTAHDCSKVDGKNGGLSLSMEIIIAAAVGGCVLLLVVFIVCLLLIRRRRRNISKSNPGNDDQGEEHVREKPVLAVVQPITRSQRPADKEEHVLRVNNNHVATMHSVESESTMASEVITEAVPIFQTDIILNNQQNNISNQIDTSGNHSGVMYVDEDDKSLASMDIDILTDQPAVDNSFDATRQAPEESEDPDYYNVVNTKTNLKIDEFETFVTKTKSLNGFKHMFLQLQNHFTTGYDVALKPENRMKNRFRGYYPYDHSRVVLTKTATDPNSDFINANYIDGINHPKAYIAAQGATTVTINDFIRMIWEQKCDKVIMLTNTREMGKIKCERYWPEEECERFGGITLTLQEETVRADFTIRHIFMIKDGIKHEFHHFHYTSWPDHDVPNVSDLLDFLYMVNKHKPNSNKPQIVHCSAGVGRTGTYITIDCGLKQGKETGSFDVIEFIKTMRNQRKGMIQTGGQLQFVYEALTEGFKYGDTSLDKTVLESQLDANNSSAIIGQISLREQCEYLRHITANTDTQGQDSSAHVYPSRTNTIGYIVADLNRHNTESIWQLIQNQQCSVAVVFLNSSNEVAICPADGTEEKYGSVELENSSDTQVSNNLNLITVSALRHEDSERKIVKVLLMNVEEHEPWLVLVNQMKELIEQIDIHNGDDYNPIAVFSNEPSVGQLLCVIRNVIQRIKLDNEVEIFQNVRKMHQQIACVIKSQDEYLSLHRFAAEYVRSASLYANL